MKNCLLEKDIEVSIISSPEKAYPSCNTISGMPVTITISNKGKQDISNFSLGYQLSGSTIVTEQFTNTILFVIEPPCW